jgi:hypothetical protein
MILREMFHDWNDTAYYDGGEDNSVAKVMDLRKTRLTLSQIRKLRMMNDQRKAEREIKLKQIKAQYGAAPAAT